MHKQDNLILRTSQLGYFIILFNLVTIWRPLWEYYDSFFKTRGGLIIRVSL